MPCQPSEKYYQIDQKEDPITKNQEEKMINNKKSQLMDYQSLSEINCKTFIINIFNKKLK